MSGFVLYGFLPWHSFCCCDEATRSAALSAEELASRKVIDYIQGNRTLWKAGRWSGLRVRAADGIQARLLLATIAKPLSSPAGRSGNYGSRQGAVDIMGLDRDFWAGKRVLLTGHTGFKGAWLTLWLAELGARVIGYSLDPPSEPKSFQYRPRA